MGCTYNPRKLPELTAADRRRWLRQVWRGPETDCWIWIGSRTLRGYGQMRLSSSRVKFLAHRIGYVIKNGPIRAGGILMHLCDNPSCVNPDHVVGGTQKKNVRDMIMKGRYRGNAVVSSACPF